MRAAGIKPGDEVITTPYTFIATSMCIMNAFAVPVYTDIDPATYNMDASQIEGLITERTKAILPVHFSGNLCDMEVIVALARKHKLVVIEDAAHAPRCRVPRRTVRRDFRRDGLLQLSRIEESADRRRGHAAHERQTSLRSGLLAASHRPPAGRGLVQALSPGLELPDERVDGGDRHRAARPALRAKCPPHGKLRVPHDRPVESYRASARVKAFPASPGIPTTS